jgi:hypothetical protein
MIVVKAEWMECSATLLRPLGARVVRYAPPPHTNFNSAFAKRLWGFRAVNAALRNECQNISLGSEELCIMSVNTGDTWTGEVTTKPKGSARSLYPTVIGVAET